MEIDYLTALVQALSDVASLVVSTLWLLVPAYIANATPVVFSGERRLDGGRELYGRPLLGAGKTVFGTLSGLLSGVIATFILLWLQASFTLPEFLPAISLWLGGLLTVGAVSGDVLASFVKRRLGLERGEPLPLVDQLDFYFGAILLSSLIFFDFKIFIMGLIVTPPVHKLFNLLAFKVSLKDVSW